MARRPPAVARVLERVTATCREHELFAPGDLVLACVSGGPDSVCMLESLLRLRRLLKIRVEVFHFDHRLRDDSHKDAEYVRRLAERHRTPLHLGVAGDAPKKGQSVEAWATGARMNAANDVRREIGAATTAEGHTLDDQAETVLLNLIRGTGLEGMAGIAPRGPAAQPLLDVRRAEVEAFCRALGLRPRRDPMNEDTRYLRAALRLEGIPALERAAGRQIVPPVSRTADLLRRDMRDLQWLASRAYGEIVSGVPPEPEMRIRVKPLTELPDAVASRVIRLAVYNLASGDWAAPWTREAIEAVLDLARGRPGRRRDLPDGSTAVRDRVYVRISRPSPESDDSATPREGE